MDTRAIGISCTWAAGQSAVQHLSLPRQRRFSPKDGLVPQDLGIWSDDHIEPLARIVRFVHEQGSVAGMQLARRSQGQHLPARGQVRERSARIEGRLEECRRTECITFRR